MQRDKKRQKLPPGIWVVATPIGNLGDLSPRAVEVLAAADLVLCEDTRRTRQLLTHAGVRAKLARHDAHTGEASARKALERVRQGEAVALVSDAGTPAVSDPGADLVRLALDGGIEVRAVPGPSAVTALLSIAGTGDPAFCFRGFFPRGEQDGAREAALAARSEASRTFVWFESPNRVEATVGILARECPGARLVAGKELTKLHEKVFSGLAPEVAREIAREIAAEGARGEWVIALVSARAESDESHASAENAANSWKIALECAISSGARPSAAASVVGQKFGVPRNVVYEAALELGGKKSSRGT